jgi:pyruvate dehydrogenase E2 component (dihydrolipoamide acetyltransferase)
MALFEFGLPELGEGLHEGRISKWLVQPGDSIQEDDAVSEVENDKSLVELPSPVSGKIVEIKVPEGATCVVGDIILTIEVAGDGQASHRVDEGSESSAVPAVAQVSGEEIEERVALPMIRQAIARTVIKSMYTAPHVTLMDEVDVTELVKLRKEIKPVAEARGIKMTYLPFIVKALIAALRSRPQLNASYDEEKQELVLKRYYHIGIMTDTDRGLLVPVVKHADQKNMWDIAQKIHDLAARGRSGKLSPNEMKGSTISITNIGSAGGMVFTPIINYPEVAILGVGRITEKPVMRDGAFAVGQMMSLSLSFDHRVIDGALGQQLVNDIKRLLENPRLLLLEV